MSDKYAVEVAMNADLKYMTNLLFKITQHGLTEELKNQAIEMIGKVYAFWHFNPDDLIKQSTIFNRAKRDQEILDDLVKRASAIRTTPIVFELKPVENGITIIDTDLKHLAERNLQREEDFAKMKELEKQAYHIVSTTRV